VRKACRIAPGKAKRAAAARQPAIASPFVHNYPVQGDATAPTSFMIHGVLLTPVYEATAGIWRPMEEMKMGVIYLTTLIAAICFTLIFALGIAGGGMSKALQFGVYFGIGAGVSMGLGTYSVLPIPLSLAMGWLLGTLAEAVVGALLLHWVFGRFGAKSA
jgi:hypothetical protein